MTEEAEDSLLRQELASIVVPAVQVVLMREGKDGLEVFLGHRIAGGFLDQWSFPGGRRDEGESDTQAGIREAQEETGVQLTEDDLVFLREAQSSTIREKAGRQVRYNYHMRVFTVNAQSLMPHNASSDEHSEMIWMTIPNALSMHDSAVAQEQALGVSRSPDKIPGALSPRTLETIKLLSSTRRRS